jgi:hypothetical protein
MTNHLQRSSLVLGATAFLMFVAGCATARPSQTVFNVSETLLPTQRCGEFFILQTRINGHGPYGLLIDTGASHLVLHNDVARTVGVPTSSGRLGFSVNIKSGPLELYDVGGTSRNLDNIIGMLGEDIAGIIGHPAFYDVLLTLDYPSRQVRIRRGRLPAADGESRFSTPNTARPFTNVELGAGPHELLVDSGSSSGIVLNSLKRLSFDGQPTAIGTAMRLYRSYTRHMVRLNNDGRIGNAMIVRPLVTEGPGTPRIGAAMMKHFVMTFDQPGRVIEILKPAPGPVQFPPNRSIGAGLEPEDGDLVISAVYPGGGAEQAGLKVGDRIVAMDGQQISTMGCEQRERRDDPSQTYLNYTVERDGSTREVRVPLVTLVR